MSGREGPSQCLQLEPHIHYFGSYDEALGGGVGGAKPSVKAL
jgi:hypothetical protein